MRQLLLAAAFLAGVSGPVLAETLRIGLVLSLSGPAEDLGRQARDGVMLAVKQAGGKFGAYDVQLDLYDDERKPARLGPEFEVWLKRVQPHFIVGPMFSDLIGQMLKPATAAGVIVLSPNAGPAVLAGKRCQPNFFSLAPQDEQGIEVLAKFAEERNLKRAVVVSTDGDAEDIAASAFKRAFKGEVLDRLVIDGQATHFADQFNRIDLLKPQAVFLHLGGPAGVRFMKEFYASGAANGPVLLGSSGFDQAELPALGEAAVGAYSAGDWSSGLKTPENASFVSVFEADYGYLPGNIAMHGYDAGLLIDRTVQLHTGALSEATGLAEAMRQAEIDSPRGKFSFGNNNFPIQDLYLTRIEKGSDGRIRPMPVTQVFAQYGDHYASECPLK